MLFGLIVLVTGPDDDRRDRSLGVETLEQGASRSHHERRWPVRLQTMEYAKTLPHRLDAGADPFEGQGLPRRKVEDTVGAEHRCGVGGQPLGLGLGGSAHENRATIGRGHEARDHEGPAGITDRDDPVTATEGGIE